MITIEEIIINSLYHRLVLVRIRRSDSQTVSTENSSTNEGNQAAGLRNSDDTVDRGLGFLYLGPNRKESQTDLSSPRNVFVDTIRLERPALSLTEPTLRLREEEVFLTSQIGRIIEIGELHLTTRRIKSSTEVQTDFEPIWCFNKSGSPIKNFGSRESLINLENCNEISLVRLESLEQPEQRSLLVINSKSDLKELTEEECKQFSVECGQESKTDAHSKIYNTKLNKSKSSDGMIKSVKRNSVANLQHDELDNLKEGLMGSYKIFNLTNEDSEIIISEGMSKESFQSTNKNIEEKHGTAHELGGIGDALKPTSFVKFVINRIDAESYGSDVPVGFIPASVDYGEMKFQESRDQTFESDSPKIKPVGNFFRERRRSSQKRSKSLRRLHGGIIDREKLLKHIMSCGAHESRRRSVGFKSPQDVITITDFKISPLHHLHAFNSSQFDLRNQNLEEFSQEVGMESCSLKFERKSRSERSSPLMMASGRFLDDDTLGSYTSNESNRKHSTIKGIPRDTLWNASCDFPVSYTSNSLPDDSSLSTFDSSTMNSSFEFEKYPDWMKNLPEKLKTLPLSQICIPGSHIALAIDKDMKTSMDFSRCNYEMAEFLRKLPNLPVFNNFRHQMKHIWKAWMPKQCLSIYDQLVAGSRYLDMRITKHSNMLYGEHGLYTGQLKRYLKEVRLFLEEHKQEVVVIHLQLSDFVESSDKKHLVTLLFQVFGTKLACWDKEMHGEKLKINFPSIERLLRAGKQAIAFMPSEDVHIHARNHIFGGSVWPDSLVSISAPKKQTLDDLKTFLDDCYSVFIKNQDQSCIMVLRAVLSPDMSMVFGRYDKRKSMKELSFTDTSPLLVDWLSSDEGKWHLNVVALDFVGAPGLVKSVLDLNLKVEKYEIHQ